VVRFENPASCRQLLQNRRILTRLERRNQSNSLSYRKAREATPWHLVEILLDPISSCD